VRCRDVVKMESVKMGKVVELMGGKLQVPGGTSERSPDMVWETVKVGVPDTVWERVLEPWIPRFGKKWRFPSTYACF
jgi:hypothetical protein